MIHGLQLIEAVIWYLLFVFTPMTDWLFGWMGIQNAVVLRVLHGLVLSYFSWRAWSALYGEKDPNKDMERVWKKPTWLTWTSLAFLGMVFFNAFDLVGGVTVMLGTMIPFEATTDAAKETARAMGMRFVTGLLTFAGIWSLKASVYGKPRKEKDTEKKEKGAGAEASTSQSSKKKKKGAKRTRVASFQQDRATKASSASSSSSEEAGGA